MQWYFISLNWSGCNSSHLHPKQACSNLLHTNEGRCAYRCGKLHLCNGDTITNRHYGQCKMAVAAVRWDQETQNSPSHPLIASAR